MQGAWVWSLVRELRSHILHCIATKKKKKIKLRESRYIPSHPQKNLYFLECTMFPAQTVFALERCFELLAKYLWQVLYSVTLLFSFWLEMGSHWSGEPPLEIHLSHWYLTPVVQPLSWNLLTHSVLFCSVLNPRKKMKCPTMRLWTKWLLDERRNLIFLW